jgi:hypothetical protein
MAIVTFIDLSQRGSNLDGLSKAEALKAAGLTLGKEISVPRPPPRR